MSHSWWNQVSNGYTCVYEWERERELQSCFRQGEDRDSSPKDRCCRGPDGMDLAIRRTLQAREGEELQGKLWHRNREDIVEGDNGTSDLVHGWVSHVFRAENGMPQALTTIYTGQKVWLRRTFFLHPDLVYEVFHTCLQAPDFKFDSDQFVGAHDGFLGLNPSFRQNPPVSLLWLKISKVLQRDETLGSGTCTSYSWNKHCILLLIRFLRECRVLSFPAKKALNVAVCAWKCVIKFFGTRSCVKR